MQIKLLGVPESKQMLMVKEWLQTLRPDEVVLAQQLLAMGRDSMQGKTKKDGSTLVAPPGGWLTIAGAVLLVAVFIAALFVPNPTKFQLWVFRITLALAGASIVAALGGLIKVQSKIKGFTIQAGGAAATFVVIYLINPPAMLDEKTAQNPSPPAPREPAVEPSARARSPQAPE